MGEGGFSPKQVGAPAQMSGASQLLQEGLLPRDRAPSPEPVFSRTDL